MRRDAFGAHTRRATALELGLRAQLGGWVPWFRPEALPGLSLAVAIAAPELPFSSQLALTKLGAWICAFDDLVDRGTLGDDEVAIRISQYEQLATGGCPEVAFDPVASVCREVLDTLAHAPLGPTLWDLVSTQLTATCRAMLGERQLLARHRAGEPVSAALYLAHGVDSIAVELATTAAAVLIGEGAIIDHLVVLRCAQRHAATAVRFANDLATASRELAEASSANLFAFSSSSSRAAVEARIEHEIRACSLATAVFAASAPLTAAFITRFADFLVSTYRHGDL